MEPESGGPADLLDVATEIRSHIAFEHEVSPHAVVLIAPGAIAKTSSGKVQRHACRIGYLSRTFEILAESEEGIAAWRQRLLSALGVNGQLIVDVIPQVELVIGRQPPAPELPPSVAVIRSRSSSTAARSRSS